MVRRRKNRTIRGVMKIKTNLHDFAMVCYRKFHKFLLLLQDVDEFTFSIVSWRKDLQSIKNIFKCNFCHHENSFCLVSYSHEHVLKINVIFLWSSSFHLSTCGGSWWAMLLFFSHLYGVRLMFYLYLFLYPFICCLFFYIFSNTIRPRTNIQKIWW